MLRPITIMDDCLLKSKTSTQYHIKQAIWFDSVFFFLTVQCSYRDYLPEEREAPDTAMEGGPDVFLRWLFLSSSQGLSLAPTAMDFSTPWSFPQRKKWKTETLYWLFSLETLSYKYTLVWRYLYVLWEGKWNNEITFEGPLLEAHT